MRRHASQPPYRPRFGSEAPESSPAQGIEHSRSKGFRTDPIGESGARARGAAASVVGDAGAAAGHRYRPGTRPDEPSPESRPPSGPANARRKWPADTTRPRGGSSLGIGRSLPSDFVTETLSHIGPLL